MSLAFLWELSPNLNVFQCRLKMLFLVIIKNCCDTAALYGQELKSIPVDSVMWLHRNWDNFTLWEESSIYDRHIFVRIFIIFYYQLTIYCVYFRMVRCAYQSFILPLMIPKVASFHANDGNQHSVRSVWQLRFDQSIICVRLTTCAFSLCELAQGT